MLFVYSINHRKCSKTFGRHCSSAALSRPTDSSISNYNEMYSLKCWHLLWIFDLRGTPPFTIVQLYDYLVIRTSRYKHIFLKHTGYKKIKSFNFFYERFNRKILVAKDADHTFFGVHMKAFVIELRYEENSAYLVRLYSTIRKQRN